MYISDRICERWKIWKSREQIYSLLASKDLLKFLAEQRVDWRQGGEGDEGESDFSDAFLKKMKE